MNFGLESVLTQKCLFVFAGVNGNERAVILASIADAISGRHLGRAEVLRYLRNFMNKDGQEHHSIDHLKDFCLLVA